MTNRAAYPSDLSDARWALIGARLTAWRQARTHAGVGGRVAEHDPAGDLERDPLRQPHRYRLALHAYYFPPWQTVYWYLTTWTTDGIFTDLNYILNGLVRTKTGRTAEPPESIMDSQSVKKTSTNVPTASQGIDASKRIVGRNSGIITDTLGLLLAVIVTAASASDNTIRLVLLDRATDTYPTLTKTWVDQGFRKKVVEHGAALIVDVEIVTKDPHVKGFSVLKCRWIVERTPRPAHATPPPRPRLRDPACTVRHHDPHRDDRQLHPTSG